ncbi:hypothetical protein Fuma_00806 [Fuerstiella marisgermanici]|uniref:Uncharacterized protein n=1 Tax=Fuerstiella marisgermanici TaxID=1891926 RepID=A0A1P8WAW9_9PLAN|nr:hypothetical protein Fuma_00806 [Fuerstiella marisgermanici]
MVAAKSPSRERIRRAVVVVLVIAGFRIYPEFAPWGTNPITILTSCSWGASFDSTEISKSTSPHSGDVKTWSLIHQTRSPRGLDIVSNAEDLQHPDSSINYWTWIISDNLVLGPRVVSQGYMSGDRIKDRKPPETSHDNHNRTIFQFEKGSLPLDYASHT